MPPSIYKRPGDTTAITSQLSQLSTADRAALSPQPTASSRLSSSSPETASCSHDALPPAVGGGRFTVRSVLTSVQGPRPRQEDKHCRVDDGWAVPRSLSPTKGRPPPARSPVKAAAAPPTTDPDRPLLAFYGVFDGHGGSRASGLASKLLWQGVRERLTAAEARAADGGRAGRQHSADDLVGALHASFADTEAEILRQATQNRWRDGSTAVCCLLHGDTLVVGNLGDSRAVLCVGGQAKGRPVSVERLSEDHKPELPSETARIVAAGGTVRCVQGIWRLNGDLSLSRALGDAEFKPKPPRPQNKRQAAGVASPATPTHGSPAGARASPAGARASPAGARASPAGARATSPAAARPPAAHPAAHAAAHARATALSAEPEFTVRRLSPDDHFVVIACDGLWDVLSDADACKHVLDALRKGLSYQQACDKLVDGVLHSAKCTDNVSVVLVVLDYVPSADEQPRGDAVEG